jgi:ABC-type uncharacterized transport system ATPase subunit
MLRQVAEETQCAMVLIDHDMGLVQAMSHRLVALELGSVIADGPPDQVMADPRVIASYLGTDDETLTTPKRKTRSRTTAASRKPAKNPAPA